MKNDFLQIDGVKQKWGDKFHEENFDNLIAIVWKEMQEMHPDYIYKYGEITSKSNHRKRKPNPFLIYLRGLKFSLLLLYCRDLKFRLKC